MPTTPNSQAKLASDPIFLRRLGSLMNQEAQVVANETPNADPDIAAKRHQLAIAILTDTAGQAASRAPTICNATNLVAKNTTFDFESDQTLTDATDAEIRSQIATLWNVMAGI